MPGACGLRPCARTHHKKGLVPHLPVGWGGQQILQLLTPTRRTNYISAAPCSLDLQRTVSCYDFKLDKYLSTLDSQLVSAVVTRYTNSCKPYYISAPIKEINFFIFVALLLILSFYSLTLVPYMVKEI